MNFFQAISPTYLPATLTDRYSLQALRERILQTVLLFALVFGLPLTLLASYRGITDGEYYLPFIYIPIYLAIAATTVMRNLPYILRGQVVTNLIFLLAISELSESGQIGEVRMLLLAFVALTAAFFSYRQIIIAILLSLGVIIGVSVYVSLVSTPIIPTLVHVREGTIWPVSSLTFLMLSSIISGAFTLLIDGLDANLKKQAALSESLARERDTLEERVSERTQGLQRRIIQSRTAAEISLAISRLSDTDTLLQQVADLLKSRFELYYVGIFLVERTGQFAVLQSGTGEAGVKMLASHHQLEIRGNSMVGWCIANRKPRIALDVGLDAVRFNNPNLPLTRSELALPIIAYDQVLGAVSIQSAQPNAFDEDDITILEGVSHSLAIAIENNRAYELSQKAIEEMKEIDRVKSQFLANMSHELRTPLNSIIGFSRVILKGIDGPINDTQNQDLNAIYNSGQHLLSLINDILDLSKIEAGKMELSFSDVNISDMINSVMSTATGLVRDKPIQLITHIPDQLPSVRADSTRVRQVLINFLSNAAKFTDSGAITVEAAPAVSPQGNAELMITVADTGGGIAPQDQSKLFLPFSQVDDSATRKTGGTGLGLSICRSLIEMHGGRIGLLRSQAGMGSTFFFTLPLDATKSTETVAASVSDAPFTLLLAIDDDPKVINLYERYLRPYGYQVFALSDPKQAVQQVKAIKPSAILLDIMMPNVDGWMVLQELKNNSDTRHIPVIVCSILEDQAKGFSLGAADYLVKPFLQEDMVSALGRLNSNGNAQKVLVVDDDPDDLRLVQKMLEGNPHFNILPAHGGKQGWEQIQSQRPDIIVLDLFMPDMNGFAVLEALRANPQLCHIPVIVLTGADLLPEQIQQLNEFGQDILSKGFLRENELPALLEDALRKFHPVRSIQGSGQ